jgi:hypothetical protein
MSNAANLFNDCVVKVILVQSSYGISAVNNLVSVKDLYFVQEEYVDVLASIKVGNVEMIQDANIQMDFPREYLIIVKFTDQDGKAYMVTVYDSDELWQDPKVMDVLPV